MGKTLVTDGPNRKPQVEDPPQLMRSQNTCERKKEASERETRWLLSKKTNTCKTKQKRSNALLPPKQSIGIRYVLFLKARARNKVRTPKAHTRKTKQRNKKDEENKTGKLLKTVPVAIENVM